MAYQFPFRRIGIYGVGLLGGSLGLALKRIFSDLEIVGIGRSEERLQKAVDVGAIDRFSCDPSSVTPLLDLLVLCTPVRLVPKVLESSLSSLKPNAVVTDVGSTKEVLVRDCEDVASGKCHFVGSHPMAGSHKTGVDAAQADLFQNKICIVTQTNASHAPSVESVVALWKATGMRVVQMAPDDHDRLTAFSSHLPHLAAAALCHAAKSQGEAIEPVLGNGFRDTTRIALGDPSMWVDICLENRPALVESLDSLQSVLSDLRNRIESNDESGVRDFLTQAQQWKKRKRSS